MRTAGRIFMLATCALVASMAIASSASAQSRAQYWIEGRGWGHGIGMSQYGANGYAQRGWTSDRIIQHYFTGTVVAPRPTDGPTNLRVLLQSYLSPARVELLSAGVVRQGAATMALEPGDILVMRSVGATLSVIRVRPGVPNAVLAKGSGADATIVPSVDGGVRALFRSDHAGTGARFRGTLTARRYDGGVIVFNTLPFESYLRGVVGDEMPPSWHPEALEAQAIAARSYALRSLRTDFNWFDVYSDTRSQVYGGIDSEDPRTDTAIANTAGLVARVGGAGGEVAQTFFFSTSGGRTAGNDEVWGSSPYSYLRSVASPFERESKYFQWRGSEVRRLTPRQLGAQLGFSTTFRSAWNTVHRSGYAKDVIVNTTQGRRTLSASSVQSRMDPVLRSTFFRINVMTITAPNATRRGAFTKLSGRIPRTGRTTLLLRSGNGRFFPVVLRPNGPLGTWVVRTRTRGDITARLWRAGLAGPAVQVRAAG